MLDARCFSLCGLFLWFCCVVPVCFSVGRSVISFPERCACDHDLTSGHCIILSVLYVVFLVLSYYVSSTEVKNLRVFCVGWKLLTCLALFYRCKCLYYFSEFIHGFLKAEHLYFLSVSMVPQTAKLNYCCYLYSMDLHIFIYILDSIIKK